MPGGVCLLLGLTAQWNMTLYCEPCHQQGRAASTRAGAEVNARGSRFHCP